jgi:hypothetical protein
MATKIRSSQLYAPVTFFFREWPRCLSCRSVRNTTTFWTSSEGKIPNGPAGDRTPVIESITSTFASIYIPQIIKIIIIIRICFYHKLSLVGYNIRKTCKTIRNIWIAVIPICRVAIGPVSFWLFLRLQYCSRL